MARWALLSQPVHAETPPSTHPHHQVEVTAAVATAAAVLVATERRATLTGHLTPPVTALASTARRASIGRLTATSLEGIRQKQGRLSNGGSAKSLKQSATRRQLRLRMERLGADPVATMPPRTPQTPYSRPPPC